MVARSRSVSATLSRISARFPPTSRWMFTARTAHLKSALPTRSASAPSASSALRPSRISATTRWNSVAAGCAISFAVVSSAWRKLWPARSELAMIVSTSGSCSRSFSARRPRVNFNMIVGPSAANAPTPSASHGLSRMTYPRIKPPKPAAAVTMTNSPDRKLTAAASSSASSRPLNPRASANRRPKLVTRAGIHPPAVRSMGTCDTLRPRLPTAAMRSPMIFCCRRRLAVPKSMTPNRNAAPVARPMARASAAGVPQKLTAASISRGLATRERRPRDR